MNFKKSLIVFRKEFSELLRDRRTLFTTIILPVILYPLLFIGFSAIMSRQAGVIEKRGATIAYTDSLNQRDAGSIAMRDSLLAKIKSLDYVTLIPCPKTVQQLYDDKEIQAVITISDSLTSSGLNTYKVDVQHDGSNERGQMIFSKIKTAVKDLEKEVVKQRLVDDRIDPEILSLVDVNPRDTSSSQKKMGMYLGMFLPYLMILMLVGGASTVAADLVAGEKERRTLETLLVSSASRQEIVLGKYLTIITMSMINVVINLISLSFSVRYLVAQSGLETSGVKMPVSAFLILLVAMLPLATLFSAILLSISTFSRNMKEARTYEQPIMMVSMLLGMVSFIPSIEFSNLLAMVPVINIALLFKAVMINEYTLAQLLITIFSTVLLDVVAIWITVKLFATESVLFRTEDDASLKSMRKSGKQFFTAQNGIICFALALGALYYLGGKWQGKDLMSGLLKTQLLIILLPVLVTIRIFKQKPLEVLRLKLPRLKVILPVPFIALSATVLVSMVAQLINLIYPFPQEYMEQLGGLFKMDTRPWVLFLVVALTPGICEEVLFRGFLFRFFERYGGTKAIIISAALFAVFHLDPFRLLPVFLLGLLLGYLTYRSRSLISSMLSHTINNALAIFLVTYSSKPWLKPLMYGEDEIRYWLAIPALLVLVASLRWFHSVTKSDMEISECAE